ncbi:MAG: glycosyltransferase family 2 protein [Burkholderiales bacterium]|jgi:GT2 family glycosyltransferase|nr:glycosyltransferase family 2 protein [Burkholderiales bacterium]
MDNTNSIATSARVFVIVINWNGEDDTCRCLASLNQVDYPNMHVVVSDNGSRPDSLRTLRDWASANGVMISTPDAPPRLNAAGGCRSICILENGRNLGFTGANTVGIQHAMRRGADYVLFLNNDTFVTPSFLSRMIDVAERNPAYGLLGCKTLLGDGDAADENRTIWSLGGYRYRFGNPMNIGSNQPDRAEWRGLVENELICGCCMLIRRKAIEDCGVQDDDLFFAIDDVEYSLRVAKAGWKNALVLDAEIYHAGSKSVEGRTGLQLYYLFRNTYYFRRKYFPWHKNIVFFTHHLLRYFLVGGLGRLLLGRGSANKGMLLGVHDFLTHRMGECPHPVLLRRKSTA